ncbi:hypothetical protein [Mycoplasmopsis edwardii]|nr:hypothetical protein [Mycoplasmopsis edwardii]
MQKKHKLLIVAISSLLFVTSVTATAVLIGKLGNKKVKATTKEDLNALVDALEYPSTNAQAKQEIKDSYKDVEKSNDLNRFKEDIMKIAEKVRSAKAKIAELSEAKRTELNAELDKTNTDEEFNALNEKIKQATFEDKKAEVLASIAALAYPSTAAQAKEDLKVRVNVLTTIEELDAFGITVANDISKKVSDLKDRIAKLTEEKRAELNSDLDSADTDAEFKAIEDKLNPIEVANKKAELDALVDAIAYPSQSAQAKQDIKDRYKDFTDVKELEKFKDTIKSISEKVSAANEKIAKVIEEKRVELNNELDRADTDAEFNALNDKLAFETRRAELITVVKELSYPGYDSTKSDKSKLDFEAEVKALTEQTFDAKEKEIKSFSEKLKAKKAILDAVPYTIQNAEGRVEVGKLVDEARTEALLDRYVPDTWVAQFQMFRDSIEQNFEGTTKDNLFRRFNITSAHSIFEGYEVKDLEFNIYETYRKIAKDWIKANVSDQTKQMEELAKIDALTRNTSNFKSSFDELVTKFKEIKNANTTQAA